MGGAPFSFSAVTLKTTQCVQVTAVCAKTGKGGVGLTVGHLPFIFWNLWNVFIPTHLYFSCSEHTRLKSGLIWFTTVN